MWCFQFEQSQWGKETPQTFQSPSSMNINQLFIQSSYFLPPKPFSQTFQVGHDFVQYLEETCLKLTGCENPTEMNADKLLQVFLQRKLEYSLMERPVVLNHFRFHQSGETWIQSCLKWPEVFAGWKSGLGLTLLLPLPPPRRNCCLWSTTS